MQNDDPHTSEVSLEERLRQVEAELAAVREELRVTQEKQRQGDATFRRFSDSGLMGIALFELSGRFVFANDALLKMIGCPPEAMAAGQVQWDQLTPPEARHRQALAIEELKSSGQCAPYEREYLRRDGTRFWGLFTGVRMTDETAVAFLLDVTERKRAEQALSAERERLQVTLTSIGDAVIVTDAQGQPIFLNPTAERLTGWTQAEASGKSLDEVFRICNEETRQAVESPVLRVLREGAVVGLANHTVLLARDGTERAIDDSAAPIPDDAGKTAGVVLVFRDVTERRRAEAALRESEARERKRAAELEAVMSAVPAAVWIAHDPACRQITGNRAAAELLRIPAAANESASAPEGERPTHFRVLQNGVELSSEALPVQRAAQGVEVRDFEEEIAFEDGTQRHLYGNATPLRDPAGQVTGAVAAFVDITERKLAEEALKAADRRKDDFLAMLAHELRNPLAPLRNAVQILRFRSGDPPTVERVREMMDRQVHHMTRLVDDLLDVSRITRGKISLQRGRLDLARLIHVNAEDHRGAFETAGLTLKLELPEFPMWVVGDPARLTQVLDNLLENASKFTDPGGEVTVSCRRSAAGPRSGTDGPVFPDRRPPTADSPGFAIVTVRDTGIGIEPESIPGLFEVFAQADRSLDRSRGGLGLGLPLVKGLIELHGGRVEARSDGIGHGAELTVWLPQADELPALSESPVTRPRGPKRLRILVVEDNRDAAESLQMLLELFGCAVSVAHSGTAGVEAAHREPPDVVLCDIGLPGMDGFAVASALRGDPLTAAARLIAVTGYGQEEDRKRVREAGFDDHLIKPVDPDVLLARLDPEAS